MGALKSVACQRQPEEKCSCWCWLKEKCSHQCWWEENCIWSKSTGCNSAACQHQPVYNAAVDPADPAFSIKPYHRSSDSKECLSNFSKFFIVGVCQFFYIGWSQSGLYFLKWTEHTIYNINSCLHRVLIPALAP